MVRTARRRRHIRHRRARFEHLEPRQYLSANQALTTDPDVQQMPSIAVNPLDSDHIVVAYMDYSLVDTGYAGIGVQVSHDGGNTWSTSKVPLPVEFSEGAANPVVKFDNVDRDANLPGIQNRVYVSFMAASFLDAKPPLTNPNGVFEGVQFRAYGMSANNGIFVSASDDGGLNWRSAATVSSRLYDGQNAVPFDIMPDLAIDTYQFLPDGTTQNPNFGNLYAVWSRYFPTGQYPGELGGGSGSNIMFAVSKDGGTTWQTQLQSRPEESADPITVLYNAGYFSGDFPEGLGLENWSHVTVGPQGDIYVSHFLGGQFAVHHSTNAGISFVNPNSSTGELYPFGVNVPTVPGVLSNNSFRLQSVRAIVADPHRPGYVYVAETNPAFDPQGNTLDEDEIIFARSTDYGRTWQRTFTVGATPNAHVINDENDGRSATGAADDVTAPQFFPRLVADNDGNLAIIWYDTRRDPLNHRIDVFGAVSTDGGLSFSANFRLTDESFDADEGEFTDARGNATYYLGDFLGMALGGGSAYAVWADTRDGNQNVEFATFSLAAPPPPPNDRYEDNNTPETATDLERIVERDLPKLTMVHGESDWFKLRTAATGTLTVTGTLAAPGENVGVELFRMTDGNLELIASGTAIDLATSLSVSSAANEDYWVRVSSGPNAPAGSAVRYTLSIKSLTADLGTRAHGVRGGELLDVGGDLFYALTAAAGGSMRVALAPAPGFQGSVRLELLDPTTLEVVASGAAAGEELVATLATAKGQKLYVHVIGDAESQGAFALTFTNFDQFTTDDIGTIFYPTGLGPSASAVADVNGDGAPDVVISHVGQNIVSVLLNNGNGTYQAPREFAIGAFQQGGPFTIQGIQNFKRDVAVVNLNPAEDAFPDIVVVNTSSSDISVLLGNGDGTFRPQRRFDATAAPYAMAVGDVNNDLIPDVVVIDATADPLAHAAVLLGRGDGSFQLPRAFTLPNREPNRTNSILLVDVDGDGKLDLVERDFLAGTNLLLGNGDGSFQLNATRILGPNGPGIEVADLDVDGDLDVVITQNNGSNVIYKLQNADGTFESVAREQFVGQFPVAVKVVDLASVLSDGTVLVGTPDGRPDLVVANNGYTLPTLAGPAEVVIMAGLTSEGAFDGFSDPVQLAAAKGPLDVDVADINDDGLDDVLLLDRDGVLIVYGRKPAFSRNDTLATARDLGTMVHMIQPTLTIVPGHTDDYYKLRVPSEAFQGAGDQVVDFSAGFANEEGAGLLMQILDAAGNVLTSGDRVLVKAEQGQELFVRIFAADTQSAGAYTLVVNTLPQVAAIESQSLLPGVGELPGGPTTSLVVVFQGDRLDLASAENKENYTVLWLGADGVVGGGDDREIAIGAGLPPATKALTYNPSRNNVDATSGRSIATALRQTVTLLFGEALPAGNYLIQVDGAVMSSSFNVEELGLLSPLAGVDGHGVVSISGNGEIISGLTKAVNDLVRPTGPVGDLTVFEDGTTPLTQSHNDLGALLDSLLTTFGDNSEITERLLLQIIAIVQPALLGPNGQLLVSLGIVLVDPTSIGLVAPDGATLVHDLATNTFSSNLREAFIEVGGNIELIVIANPVGDYELTLGDVPARARAGVVYFGRQGPIRDTFTDELRAKTLASTFVAEDFRLNIRYVAPTAARRAVPTVVAFAAPTFLPTFVSTSFVTGAQRVAAVVPNLLLTTANRSSGILAGDDLLRTFGSGGSAVQSLFRAAAEEAWEVVFSSWDRLTQVLRDSPLDFEVDENREDTNDSPAAASLEQAWQAFSSAIGEMFAPEESASRSTDEEQQTSQSREVSATTDGAGAEGSSQENVDQSAATAVPEKSKPSGASTDNQEEDAPHATAA